jgi:hypothetical protein
MYAGATRAVTVFPMRQRLRQERRAIEIADHFWKSGYKIEMKEFPRKILESF